MVTVLIAGRPMLIDSILEESSAVLDAFLPGTSGGQGIVDALTGAYVLRPNGQSDSKNSLSFDWPRNSVNSLLCLGSAEEFPNLQVRRQHSQNRGPVIQSRLRPQYLNKMIVSFA